MKKIHLLLLSLLLLTACTFNTASNKPPVSPAGFYRSSDRGQTWELKASLYSLGGENKTFAGVSITKLHLDPADHQTLYLGTETNGLLYSHDQGDGWFFTVPGAGVINDVAVDPNDKCNIFAAVHNKVYKSTDCTRSWELIHLTSLESEFFTALAIDPFDSRIVYLGSSRGTVLWSQDAGYSWQAVRYLPSRVVDIFGNAKVADSLYVATASSGIFHSTDRLVTWENLLDKTVQSPANTTAKPKALKDLSGAAAYLYLAYDYSQTNGLLYSNNYGIFRLLDSGDWQEIVILNKPNEERVLTIAVNPNNGQEIFFATDGAFYQTANGGQDWTVKPLPPAGSPTQLLVDPENTDLIYLGFYRAQK